MKLFYLIIFFLVVAFADNVFAQGNSGLVIEGSVKAGDRNAGDARIELYRNGQLAGNHYTGNNGRYSFTLDLNSEYTLIYSYSDYFPQKILVDTNVPQSILLDKIQFFPFAVDINLLPEVPGVDDAFTQNTMMRVYYNDEVKDFIPDIQYTEEQLKQVVERTIRLSRETTGVTGSITGSDKPDTEEKRKAYNQLIQQAEMEYNREEFLEALDGYQAASAIFPEEQYPKDRISEINDLLGLLMVAEEREQAVNVRLNELLEQADMHFAGQNYEEAGVAYKRALSVDPDNSHAVARLAEIEVLLNNSRTNKEYGELIVAADNAFDELLYENALELYRKALQLKQGEAYPEQRIEETEQILEKLASNDEKLKGYRQSMLQAEKNIGAQMYEQAIKNYEQALTFKPGDDEAVAGIEEVKALMSRADIKSQYENQIKVADAAFEAGQYEDAMAAYEEASAILPAEEYPEARIQQINEIAAEMERLAAQEEQARQKELEAEKERQYRNTMNHADSLFNMKEYEDALEAYERALQLKPEESLPGRKIKVTEVMISRQVAGRQAYETAVAEGDRAFELEQFEEAENAYKEALEAMPDEAYPAGRLAEIKSLMEQRARQEAEAKAAEQARVAALAEEKERAYNKTIAGADSMLMLNDFEGAREAYVMAQQLKPDEQLPERRIAEINEALSRIEEAGKAYDAAVDEGDEAFEKGMYEVAVAAYEKAQQAVPEETYPAERLAQIDSVREERLRLAAEAEAEKVRLAAEAEQAEQARLKAIEAEKELKYSQALVVADSLLAEADYEGARTAYLLAQQIKPEEVLPAEKITEIDNLINTLAATRKKFDDAVADGDEAFNGELYDEAEQAYLEALDLLPEENYPAERLAQIDSIQNARARLAEETAERERQEAEAEAEKAAIIAGEEAALQERLAAEEAENDEKYRKAVAAADSLLAANDYAGARSAYDLAQQIKPDESLPSVRIAEIDERMNELAAIQQQYDAAIVRGDEAFRDELFEEARDAYQRALQLMPGEEYPTDMLAQIDDADEARTQQKAEAEADFATVSPEENNNLPDNETVDADIQEITTAEEDEAEQKRLSALQAEKDLQYNYAISRGDSHYNLKEYEQSLIFYNQALEVNNDALYPRQRIAEINKVLNGNLPEQQQQAQAEQDYRNALQNANQQFDAEDFQQAITGYEQALEIKPGEAFPTQRISEAKRLMQQQQLDERYGNILLVADELFDKKDWEDARKKYQNALDLQPDESYPRSRLAQIDERIREQEARLLAEEQAAVEREKRQAELEQQQMALNESQQNYYEERNRLYSEYIALADESFSNKHFNISRAWYYKAADVKQDEAYPKQRIDEINDIVEGLMDNRQEREYQALINRADSTFREGNLVVARGWYYRALALKPEAAYPKEQLDAVAEEVAERLSIKQKEEFNSNMQQAAEASAIGNHSLAKFWILKALDIDPDNITAKKKLEETEEFLKEKLPDNQEL